MIVNLQPHIDPQQQAAQEHAANRMEVKVGSYWLCFSPQRMLRAVQINGYVFDRRTGKQFLTGRMVDSNLLADVPAQCLAAKTPLFFARLMTDAFDRETAHATTPDVIKKTEAYAQLAAAFRSGKIPTRTFVDFADTLLQFVLPGRTFPYEKQLAAMLLAIGHSDEPEVQELIKSLNRKRWDELPLINTVIQGLNQDRAD